MAKLKATTHRDLVRNVFRGYDHENEVQFKIGHNTTAEFVPHDGSLFKRDILIRLHGHAIVRLEPDDGMLDGSGPVNFTLAGYGTTTTRERVNQFINCDFCGNRKVYQKRGIQYLDDMPIYTDEWYRIL